MFARLTDEHTERMQRLGLTPWARDAPTRSDAQVAAEADPATLGRADLDVGELVGRDDDDPALLVDQGERAAGGQRRVDGCGDLVGGLRRLERDLAGALRRRS